MVRMRKIGWTASFWLGKKLLTAKGHRLGWAKIFMSLNFIGLKTPDGNNAQFWLDSLILVGPKTVDGKKAQIWLG